MCLWYSGQGKFSDLVDFVNKQAKEALHPLFGDIKDFASKIQAKGQVDEKLHSRSGIKRVFNTAATITGHRQVASPSAGVTPHNGCRDRTVYRD